MMKLIAVFLILANAPKNGEHLCALTEIFVMFFFVTEVSEARIVT
jgi:hypothetical protein